MMYRTLPSEPLLAQLRQIVKDREAAAQQSDTMLEGTMIDNEELRLAWHLIEHFRLVVSPRIFGGWGWSCGRLKSVSLDGYGVRCEPETTVEASLMALAVYWCAIKCIVCDQREAEQGIVRVASLDEAMHYVVQQVQQDSLGKSNDGAC